MMKKVAKMIALIMAFSMMFSTVTFAAENQELGRSTTLGELNIDGEYRK